MNLLNLFLFFVPVQADIMPIYNKPERSDCSNGCPPPMPCPAPPRNCDYFPPRPDECG